VSKKTDILFVLLGRHLDCFSLRQLRESRDAWMEDREKSLVEVLLSRGLLSERTAGALEVLVAEQMEKSGGDLEEALRTCPVSERVRMEVMTCLEGYDVRDTTQDQRPPDTLPGRKPGTREVKPSTTKLRRGHHDKYLFRGELGRGGVSRVIDAIDTDFGREVAVKMMLPGQVTEGIVDRFLVEGQVAGRLPHPNIVPVFEIGVLKDGEIDAPYFTMTKIKGRNLSQLLKSIERGDPEDLERYTRPRLLGMFQDVCNAVEFAHDHGVIHRDLKPANVMVGDYGEVFVVDWGLAKFKDQIEVPLHERPAPARTRTGDSTQVTVEGDVIGTPSYMPPEQADGRIHEIDESSDIYSLGAILYQVLTFRPPFEGATVFNVVKRVLEEPVVPPSQRAAEVREEIEGPLPAPVPPELDEVVLRALSKRKEDRYKSAREFSNEIQRFLEGEKERRRDHQKAEGKIRTGRTLLGNLEKMREEMNELELLLLQMNEEVKPHWPVERKRELWDLQKKYRELGDEIVHTYTRAGRSLQAALEFERTNAEARAALADMYWKQYLYEEELDNRREMIFCRNMVEEYNDGKYDAALKGDGSLSVTTRVCPCPCLREGRSVPPGELEVLNFHPLSGRPLPSGEGGAVEHEPSGAVDLKVHGPRCKTKELKGADAWLFRFEERSKLSVPVFPQGVEPPEGGGEKKESVTGHYTLHAALDALFGPESPYRPERGLYLGKTPVAKFSAPMGSYLLVISAKGFGPVRMAVKVDRLGDERVSVNLYREDEIPEGFLQVPAGGYPYQGDRGNPYSGALMFRWVDDFFLSRFPVTCGEYLEFLNALAGENPAEAMARAPRRAPTSGWYWPRDADARYAVPTESWFEEASDAARERASRLEMCPIWWDENWPVFGVSWEDLMALANRRTRESSHLFCLPHEAQWEKAARGVDGRVYPWGDEFDGTFCNFAGAFGDGIRPVPVDSFPADESPYGVRGLGGNARDGCLNSPGAGAPGVRTCRGGAWPGANLLVRCASRTAFPTTTINYYYSGRLAWIPALGGHR
jgi:serine/threonine protein kinase/formylglycine-generating enzyme required for sulfatase activity